MNDRVKAKSIIILIILLILGTMVSVLFQKLDKDEAVYLPLHIPALIGGFLLPPIFAMILGVLLQVISGTIITPVPLFPTLFIGIFEMAVYGLIVSLLYRKLKAPSLLSLIFSIVLGRIMVGVIVFFATPFYEFGIDPINYVIEVVVTGLPGIIIQLVAIPLLIYWIERYTTINLD